MNNLYGKLKDHFMFSKEEVSDLCKASIVFGFMLSFADWGMTTFDAYAGIYSWTISIIAILIFYSLYLAIIKALAIHNGYLMEFTMSKVMWAIALFFTVFTEGYNHFILFIPGALAFSVVKKHRLGKLSQGADYDEFGYIGVEAALIMIILGSIFAPLYGSSIFFEKIVLVCLLTAMFSMLPVPYTTGFYLITVSFLAYLSLATLIILGALLATFEIGTFYTLLIAGIATIIAWFISYKYLP